jgi:hypothetical protein
LVLRLFFVTFGLTFAASREVKLHDCAITYAGNEEVSIFGHDPHAFEQLLLDSV